MKAFWVVLIAMLPVAAGAATIQVDTPFAPAVLGGDLGCTWPPQQCLEDLEWGATGPPYPLVVPGFDAALGELQSVDFELQVEIALETTYWDNPNWAPPGGTTSLSLRFNAVSPFITGVSVDRVLYERVECLPASTCQMPWNLSTSGSQRHTGDLSMFQGPDPLFFEYGGSLSITASPNYDGVQTRSADIAQATLRTTYTYVPEPGTGLLLGLGLAVAATWRARRLSGAASAQRGGTWAVVSLRK